MIDRHSVSPVQFAELSSGGGGGSTIRLLRDTELSRHLLLIRYIADAVPKAAAGGDDALAVLDAARAQDPGSAAETLSDPMVGAWTAHAARVVRSGANRTASWSADAGQLAALAAVTAARAGVDAELEMARYGHAAMLPTMGQLVGLDPDDYRPLRLRVRAGTLTVAGATQTIRPPTNPGADTRHWQGLRQLTAESGGHITLDDVNHYRDIYHVPALGRASVSEVRHWERLFADAWLLLARHATGRSAEIACGMRTVVPLLAADERIGRSATARVAFGAFGATRPAGATELAMGLVHEFQHSKLNALIHLVPLWDPNDRARYFAPWRSDPRPIGGLYQGVYAFLAVADLLHRLRAEPGQEAAAERQFAVVREQLRSGLESLLGAPSLTRAGREFATGMATSLDGLDGLNVSQAVVDVAHEALGGNRAKWQERHGRVE